MELVSTNVNQGINRLGFRLDTKKKKKAPVKCVKDVRKLRFYGGSGVAS